MKSYEEVLSVLPAGVMKEINKMDLYLKSLSTLKFKRTVDKKNNKISYVSIDYGISYLIKLKNTQQEFGWYYIYDKQEEKWYRKTDYMINVFNEINPDIAERLFSFLTECTFCRDVENCGRLLYEYKGQKKTTHYGRVILGLKKQDFDDVKDFFNSLETLYYNKLSSKI
jgi:hypothetical protein